MKNIDPTQYGRARVYIVEGVVDANTTVAEARAQSVDRRIAEINARLAHAAVADQQQPVIPELAAGIEYDR